MYKKLLAAMILLALFSALLTGCFGADRAKDFSVVSKEIKANSTNQAVITVKVKNVSSQEAARIMLKAKLLDETGKVLEEPFELAGPIKGNEEKTFEIKSYADYYKVKTVEVFVESAD